METQHKIFAVMSFYSMYRTDTSNFVATSMLTSSMDTEILYTAFFQHSQIHMLQQI